MITRRTETHERLSLQVSATGGFRQTDRIFRLSITYRGYRASARGPAVEHSDLDLFFKACLQFAGSAKGTYGEILTALEKEAQEAKDLPQLAQRLSARYESALNKLSERR